MGTRWRILGAGYRHDLFWTFDLADYNRSAEVSGVPLIYRDGQQTDPRTLVPSVTEHHLNGVLTRSAGQSPRTWADQMVRAGHAPSDEVYLVDVAAERRVKVSLLESALQRDGNRLLPSRLSFRTSDRPYWEATQATKAQPTKANPMWADVPLGNAPSDSILEVYEPDVLIRGVTLVQGNWSFCCHMGVAEASAINSVSGAAPWGKVTGTHTATDNVKALAFGLGRRITVTPFTFSSLIQRTDRFSFLIKYRTNGDFSGTKTFFDFNLGTASVGTHHLFLRLANGQYTFGHSAGSVSGMPTGFVQSQDRQIAGWFCSTGSLVGATVFNARLIEGTSVIGSATPAQFPAVPIQTLTNLWIGTDLAGVNPCSQDMDEVYFSHQVLGDAHLKGEAVAARQLFADNLALGYRGTLQAGQVLVFDTGQRSSRLFTQNNATWQGGGDRTRGNYPVLGKGSLRGAGNWDTVFFWSRSSGSTFGGAVHTRKAWY